MATFSFIGGTLRLGSFSNFTSLTRAVAFDVSVEAQDGTTMSHTTRVNVGGQKACTWSAEMLVDHAGLMDSYLWDFIDNQRHVLMSYMPPSSSAVGDLAYFMNSRASVKKRPFTLGEMSTIEINGEAYEGEYASQSQSPVRGVYAGAFTGTTTPQVSTGFQLGALAAANQIIVCGVHYTSYTGPGDLTISVESDDNSGFTSATTRATATAVTSISSQPRVPPVVGPITDDWWRLRAVKTSGALCGGEWFIGKISV